MGRVSVEELRPDLALLQPGPHIDGSMTPGLQRAGRGIGVQVNIQFSISEV